MTCRFFLLAALLLANATVRAETPEEKAGFAPKLLIYLAKGQPNSCGTGCDHWIAIEGKLDGDAATRVRRFLLGVKDTRRRSICIRLAVRWMSPTSSGACFAAGKPSPELAVRW
jgi:hypothetical protein